VTDTHPFVTMRVNFARFEQAQQALGSVPLYPLAKWNVKDDDDTSFRSVKLDLKTNPSDTSSAKFSSYFKVFESGSPEQWCRWREDLSTVFKGLNLTTGPNQIGMVQHLLAGQARDTFNEFFSDSKNKETTDNVQLGLKKVASTIFTDSAVTNQKQYMRHELRKPNKLTARETATRLQQLNTWLAYFPADGDDATAAVTKLDEIEIREIYYRLLPIVWRRKMDENVNFDRTRDGLRGLVEYAERLETSEARFDGKTKEQASSKEKSQVGSNKPDGVAKKGKPETGRANSDGNRSLPTWIRDCLVHGPGCGHPSHKCKILMDHAEKVKGQFKAQYKDKNVYKKSSQSKPWKKDNKERTYTKKEVQMLLKRTSERLKEKSDSDDDMDKELNQIGKFSADPEPFEEWEEVDSMLNEFHIE
jgi:hypothetical protein